MRKRLTLLLLLLLSVTHLSGCVAAIAVGYAASTAGSAKYDGDNIIYNDDTYVYAYDKILACYSPAIETFNPRQYADEKEFLGRSLTMNSIYSAWEKDFGDNVVQDFDLDDWHGYYFKEGFELPDYKTLAIDEIFVNQVSCMKSAGEKNILITDIVDFSTQVVTNASERYDSAFCCTLREYDCILMGSYDIAVINGAVYLEIPGEAKNTFCKIKDNYQMPFIKMLSD